MTAQSSIREFAKQHMQELWNTFIPQPGPQRDALISKADVTLYGGAAGGGKSYLACGLAVTKHLETLYIRRESKQLDGVVDELEKMIGSKSGYSGQSGIWRFKALGMNKKITLGSVPHLGDEQRYQGRPRDLLILDEAATLLEQQVQFLMGWVRTTVPGQRCRTLMCSNPPTSAEGEWMIRMFAPWLDPSHPDPAKPGELRWYVRIAGEDIAVSGPDPVKHDGEVIEPQSRTFIPARIADNKYLMQTGYLRTLQAMPEPLRSMMLFGDFTAGREDDEWQALPSAWIRAAQDRWEDPAGKEITSIGVDPSRGGRDQTVLAARSGWAFHRLQRYEGEDMQSGQAVAGKVVEMVGTQTCPVNVDVIGIGASVVDQLEMLIGTRVVAVNSSHKSEDTDYSGNLTFANKRAELWWRFRDLLNPETGSQISLPPDPQLVADLCAPRYKLTPSGIQIEKKDDIVRRLGRSTDSADAVIMAAERTATVAVQTGRVVVHGSMNRRGRNSGQ